MEYLDNYMKYDIMEVVNDRVIITGLITCYSSTGANVVGRLIKIKLDAKPWKDSSNDKNAFLQMSQLPHQKVCHDSLVSFILVMSGKSS
jgi:hypothetical protein